MPRAGVAAGTSRFYETEGLISGAAALAGIAPVRAGHAAQDRLHPGRASGWAGIAGHQGSAGNAARRPYANQSRLVAPRQVIEGHGLPRSPHCNGCVSNWTVAPAVAVPVR